MDFLRQGDNLLCILNLIIEFYLLFALYYFCLCQKGTAHSVTEVLAGRLGKGRVLLNQPVTSIKQVNM